MKKICYHGYIFLYRWMANTIHKHARKTTEL